MMKDKLVQSIKRYPKVVLLLFLLVISASSFTVGTYAWYVSSDQTENKFQGTVFQSQIAEVFAPVVDWQPNQTKPKQVSVQNAGEMPSFVRLSLYEFLIDFKINYEDQSGNANLEQLKGPTANPIDEKNTDTWVKQHSYLANDGNYYLANHAWVPSTDPSKQQMFTYNPDRTLDRNEFAYRSQTYQQLKYFQLNFNKNLTTAVQANTQDGYWLYEKGYFYYSKPLQPGETTSDLLESVGLTYNFPNKYKNALYTIKVFMDAHDPTDSIYANWGISTDSEAGKLIKAQLN